MLPKNGKYGSVIRYAFLVSFAKLFRRSAIRIQCDGLRKRHLRIQVEQKNIGISNIGENITKTPRNGCLRYASLEVNRSNCSHAEPIVSEISYKPTTAAPASLRLRQLCRTPLVSRPRLLLSVTGSRRTGQAVALDRAGQSVKGSRTSTVSSRSGLVDNSATGAPISSSTRRMYFTAAAGRSAQLRAPRVLSDHPSRVS